MTVEKGGGEHWIATGIWTLSRRPGSTLHKPEQKVQEIQPFDPGEDSGDMAGTHGPSQLFGIVRESSVPRNQAQRAEGPVWIV